MLQEEARAQGFQLLSGVDNRDTLSLQGHGQKGIVDNRALGSSSTVAANQTLTIDVYAACPYVHLPDAADPLRRGGM